MKTFLAFIGGLVFVVITLWFLIAIPYAYFKGQCCLCENCLATEE